MHKEIIIKALLNILNAIVSLFIAYVAYTKLGSTGVLNFSGEYIKEANVTGGIVFFILAFFLLDKAFRRLLAIKPHRLTLTLTGNVSDKNDNSIISASVYVRGANTAKVLSGNTGYFSIEVDANKTQWIIVAEHNGYETASVTVAKNKTDDIAIILKKKPL
jgi:hypothetical protein